MNGGTTFEADAPFAEAGETGMRAPDCPVMPPQPSPGFHVCRARRAVTACFFRYYRQCKAMAFVHMPFLPRRLFSRPGTA